MKLRRDIFQAISDPTRRSILLLLATQTMTAGAIAGNFDMARPTISKHLQILHECDLIESQPQGREIYYHFKVDKLREIDLWIDQLRQQWENRFDNLDQYFERIQSDN